MNSTIWQTFKMLEITMFNVCLVPSDAILLMLFCLVALLDSFNRFAGQQLPPKCSCHDLAAFSKAANEKLA